MDVCGGEGMLLVDGTGAEGSGPCLLGTEILMHLFRNQLTGLFMLRT